MSNQAQQFFPHQHSSLSIQTSQLLSQSNSQAQHIGFDIILPSKMQYFTLLAAATLIQGALSGGISVFDGPNCTGKRTDVHFDADKTVPNIAAFQSYRENGYGQREQRIQFYTQTGAPGQCGGEFLYDTWAYDGDYFHSHQCYNIIDHPNTKWHYARCIKSVHA